MSELRKLIETAIEKAYDAALTADQSGCTSGSAEQESEDAAANVYAAIAALEARAAADAQFRAAVEGMVAQRITQASGRFYREDFVLGRPCRWVLSSNSNCATAAEALGLQSKEQQP